MWRNEAYGVTAEPIVIAYNKTLLPPEQVPQTRADLIRALTDHPETWQGKVAAYDPERSGVGSLILAQASSDKLANRQLLINPAGEIVTTYDKIHLFDVSLENGEGYKESAAYDRGSRAKVTEVDGVRVGHAICYDLRFPALFRALAADVQLLPAAFTQTTGQAHWHPLLRSRAIENGCFVLAAAQTGLHDGTRRTYGHSLVIDPWGQVLLDMGTEPGVGVVDLDLSLVAKRRAQIPAMTADQPFDAP